MLDVFHAAFGIRGHRAELDHSKAPLIKTDTLLNEEHRTRRVKLDCDRGKQKQRRAQDEQEHGTG